MSDIVWINRRLPLVFEYKMKDYITIGQIVRAAGIRGEVKVKPLTDDPNRFKQLKTVYIGEKPYRIEALRLDGDFVYLRFGGVSDRNTAETLKDEFIEIDRVNSVPLAEGSYFIADVIGCKLYTSDGKTVGKVTEVNQYGAADVFTAFDGVKTVRFPFLKRMIVKVDVENDVIIVDKKTFDEVSVCDD